MKIVFLGRLADLVSQQEWIVAPPREVSDVEGLREWLGADFPEVLDPRIRLVVNNELARDGQAVALNDEVAFFPPLSGG